LRVFKERAVLVGGNVVSGAQALGAIGGTQKRFGIEAAAQALGAGREQGRGWAADLVGKAGEDGDGGREGGKTGNAAPGNDKEAQALQARIVIVGCRVGRKGEEVEERERLFGPKWVSAQVCIEVCGSHRESGSGWGVRGGADLAAVQRMRVA